MPLWPRSKNTPLRQLTQLEEDKVRARPGREATNPYTATPLFPLALGRARKVPPMPQKRTTKTGKIRWVARYRDHAGKEHSKSFETRREAKTYEEEQERALRRQEWIDPRSSKTTLRQLALSWAQATTAASTRQNREFLAKNLGELGDMPLRSVTSADLLAWRSVLLDGRPWAKGVPLKESTVAIMMGQVAGILRRAVEDDLIAKAPAIRAPKTPPKASVLPKEIPTLHEIQRLLNSRGGR